MRRITDIPGIKLQSIGYYIAVLAAASILFLKATVAFADGAVNCSLLAPDQDMVEQRTYLLDKVWTGTRVDFSAISYRHKVYAAYYDKDRWLTLVEVDLQSMKKCQLKIQSRFEGWDSHNITALAFAPDGSLHVAANMHSSPLIYGHTDASGDLKTFRLASMLGRDEQRVTYPTFLSNRKDYLLFLYRSGESGNGIWLANRWANGRWSRIGNVFSDSDRSGPMSAYPTTIEQDASGFYHVAVVWRRTSDIRTNFAISYGRTRDFVTWFKADGSKVAAPLNIDSADLIDAPGEEAGLLNNAKLALTDANNPVVIYTRYGGDGKNRIYAAKWGKGNWETKEIATSTTRIELSGGGTVTGAPDFKVQSLGDIINIGYTFPGGAKGYRYVDLSFNKFEMHQATKPEPAVAEPKKFPDVEGLESGVFVARPIRNETNVLTGWLFWSAQGANRDIARKCDEAMPHACDPPAKDLKFTISSEESR